MEIRIGAVRLTAVVKIEKNMWEEREGEISLKRKKNERRICKEKWFPRMVTSSLLGGKTMRENLLCEK